MYTLLLVLFGWVFFDATGLPEAFKTFGAMFGGSGQAAGRVSLYYLRSYALPLALAFIGATKIPIRVSRWIRERKPAVFAAIDPAAIVVLFVVVTAFLVDGSFNPFIYFRF